MAGTVVWKWGRCWGASTGDYLSGVVTRRANVLEPETGKFALTLCFFKGHMTLSSWIAPRLLSAYPERSLRRADADRAAAGRVLCSRRNFGAVSTLERVRAAYNPDLIIEGVLLTMYDDRTNLAQQAIRDALPTLENLTATFTSSRSVHVGLATHLSGVYGRSCQVLPSSSTSKFGLFVFHCFPIVVDCPIGFPTAPSCGHRFGCAVLIWPFFPHLKSRNVFSFHVSGPGPDDLQYQPNQASI